MPIDNTNRKTKKLNDTLRHFAQYIHTKIIIQIIVILLQYKYEVKKII